MTDHFIASPSRNVCYFKLVFSTVTHPLVQNSLDDENTKPLFLTFLHSALPLMHVILGLLDSLVYYIFI